jgi:hypothetical protein
MLFLIFYYVSTNYFKCRNSMRIILMLLYYQLFFVILLLYTFLLHCPFSFIGEYSYDMLMACFNDWNAVIFVPAI